MARGEGGIVTLPFSSVTSPCTELSWSSSRRNLSTLSARTKWLLRRRTHRVTTRGPPTGEACIGQRETSALRVDDGA